MNDQSQKILDTMAAEMAVGFPMGPLHDLMHLNAQATSSALQPNEPFTLDTLEKLMDRRSSVPMLKIMMSDYCQDLVQFRFPKSKKRRIRQKWAKRIENYRTTPSKDFKMMGDTLLAHTSMKPVLEAIVEAMPKVNPLLSALLDSSMMNFGAMLPLVGISQHHRVDGVLGELDPDVFGTLHPKLPPIQ